MTISILLEIGHSWTDQVLGTLLKSEIIDTSIDKLIRVTSLIGLMLGAIFYFISFGWNYAITSLKNLKEMSADPIVDYEELARTIFLLGCIVLFPTIATVLSSGMDFVNKFTAPGTTQANYLEQYSEKMSSGGAAFGDIQITQNAMQEAMDNANKKGDKAKATFYSNQLAAAQNKKSNVTNSVELTNTNSSNKSTDPNLKTEPMQSSPGWGFLNPENWVPMAVTSLFGMLNSFIRLLVGIFAISLLKVLMVIGPLAFAFSILPGFKSQVGTWFGTVLNTGFVFTTMNILDHLSYYMLKVYTTVEISGAAQSGSEATASLLFNICMTLLYTMSFWLTSKFIGKGDGGRVLTKAVAVGAAIVGGAALMGGAAAAQGTNVTRTMDAAKDILKDGD